MAPTPTDGNLKNLKNHARYYHPGGDLIIIIDDTSFCVASFFFTRESPIFRERLETSTETGTTAGLKTKQTIVIQPSENVTTEDFEKLCWVFYNGTFGVYDAPLETWKVILRLATQYQFPEVKNLALRELDKPRQFPLSLVERIVLYRQYDADKSYLERRYAKLLYRSESLTLEECDALGMALVRLVFIARENLRATCDKLPPLAPLPKSMEKTIIETVRSTPWNGSSPSPTNPNKPASTSTPTTNGNGRPGVSTSEQKI